MNNKESHNSSMEKSLEKKIRTINNQIDDFQSQAQELPGDIGNELSSIVKDLKFRRKRLENKLDTFKGATDNAYKDLQTGVQLAWENLNMAYESAKERFEKEAS